MRIVIVSDLHGNWEAIEALPRSWDQLWVLGDLVNYGPNPAEAVEFVRRHASVVVRGNHDHALGFGEDPRCSARFREMASQMQTYTSSVLSQEQKAYLRALPSTARVEAGGCRFFLCHAHPADPLFRYSPGEPALWEADAATIDADVLLVGHTHLPFELHLSGRRVANPGSLGQPKHGAPEACYAVWEDGWLALERRPYPFAETIRKIMMLPIDPRIAAELAEVLRRGAAP